MTIDLQSLTTEANNPLSSSLDQMSAREIVELMNREDASIADAVQRESAKIATAVDTVADRFERGGRLIYMGAGTSGRLGVLDASECPPTFGSDPRQVVGLIAGGREALVRAIEGAEDDPEQGTEDLNSMSPTEHDVVCGIATSGRTPYVIGGLQRAQAIGAYRIGIVCNQPSEMDRHVDLLIAPIAGPEIVSGSTRMKAGTATKMVLNMITTGAMIRIGKTYGNWMVDLKATNQKLSARSLRMVRRLCDLGEDEAADLLRKCDGEVKTALACYFARIDDAQLARQSLAQCQGHLRVLIERASS